MNTSEGATRLGHNALIQNMIPELHVNQMMWSCHQPFVQRINSSSDLVDPEVDACDAAHSLWAVLRSRSFR